MVICFHVSSQTFMILFLSIQYYKVHTEEQREETCFVDRDRAAAVSEGARDIRGDVKQLALTLNDAVADDRSDEAWIFTYIKQGQYELKYVTYYTVEQENPNLQRIPY